MADPQEVREQEVGGRFDEAVRHHQAGRLGEAERLYRQILAIDSRHADSLHLLGVIAHQVGRLDIAVELIVQAIAINGGVAAYHSNLGLTLHGLGRLEEAEARCRRALAIAPDFAEAHCNLGLTLQRQGRLDEATACYRHAVAIRPTYAEAFTNLGVALHDLGRPDEAAEFHRKAIALNPAYAEAYTHLGLVQQDLGRLDEAAASHRTAIGLNPAHAGAHTNLGLALLQAGNFAEGWREYEWRWQVAPLATARRDFAQPQWRGEDGAGRTLLLHAEQGLGDTLQFCRYGPLAAARGWRVILEVPKPLVRLVRSLAGIDQVVAEGEPLPAFDFHCPMLSLPLAFGTTLDTIPAAIPYLHADEALVAAWSARLAAPADQRLRVGLVWAGTPRIGVKNHRRSIPADRLLPLAGLAGLRLVSLQKDAPPAPSGLALTDVMDEIDDFADTAALIANLDLVIAVDTSVAHLAGALGKPVWLLNRFDTCWRWMLNRSDSPWYPTLRLFRQPKAGDWETVIERVRAELGQLGAAKINPRNTAPASPPRPRGRRSSAAP